MIKGEEKANTDGACTNKRRLPHINLRPLLFCAMALGFGLFAYYRAVLGGFSYSSLVLFLFVLIFGLAPFTRRRLLFLAVSLAVCTSVGVLCAHISVARFRAGADEGEYTVTGTVESISIYNGFTTATLSSLRFDGERAGGRISAGFASEDIRPGDVMEFECEVTRNELGEYVLSGDLRYRASVVSFEKTGSKNALLKLNGAVYDVLHRGMTEDEADVAYAILTGNSSMIDEGLLAATRQGGIAHVFAVSGLHIGILYAAVQALCRRIKKFSFIPATALALCYAAFCGFSVSAIRAVIMSASVGVNLALGRKPDFPNSIALAAIFVFLFLPAQWLTVGFRLSFGACIGLALFSGFFQRIFRKIKIPRTVATCLSASISVQLFTVPISLEAFGYVSFWGTLLNLALVPLLPFLFLGLVLCVLFSLVTTATFFLSIPAGMLSFLILILSLTDLSFVIAGFALGTGGVAVLTACVAVSPRVRLRPLARGVAAGALCILFAVILLCENTVVSGLRIVSGNAVALIVTPHEHILVLGETTLSGCEDFLNRNFGGTLDAIFVLSDDGLSAINVAAFLKAREIRYCKPIATGLQKTNVVFSESATIGEMYFCYERNDTLCMTFGNLVVEFDFVRESSFDSDLFIGMPSDGLKFSLRHDIINTVS